jgi:hypothetical protein
VPENLKSLLRTLQHMYNSCPPHPSSFGIVRSCATALIFVARHEPELFPKPLARTMVRRIKGRHLLHLVQDVEGLDLGGVDVNRLSSRWESLDARSLGAMERLIEPRPFARILDAYTDEDVDIEAVMKRLFNVDSV